MFKIFGLVIALIIVLAVISVVVSQASEKWSVGEVVRTPEQRFENLPDYPFAPNYVDSLGYRIHYIDEGPHDGQVILLMHGQPSWSYLYRHMIPLLTDAGFRVIAPDNVGFGKSDKPVDPNDHTYQMHIDVMSHFVEQLGLNNITFFGQDWGGLIGLRVVANTPELFSRIMLSNTALPAAPGIKGWLGFPLFRLSVWMEGNVQDLDTDSKEFSFTKWVAYARHTNSFDFAGLFQRATTRTLSEEDLAGYAAPYPSNEYIAAVRIFPTLVASQLRQNQKVMDEFYANWKKPLLTAFGTDDVIMKGRDKVWQTTAPGAKGQPHTLVEHAHHFIQDDKPEELSNLLIEFINNN
jgi:haloalkane dehalogenase